MPFNFPFFFGKYRYPHSYLPNDFHNKHISSNLNAETCSDISSLKKDSEIKESSESFFEIFGIKLYFDDILIICILFFLYNERVQDDELFICLILLLIS